MEKDNNTNGFLGVKIGEPLFFWGFGGVWVEIDGGSGCLYVTVFRSLNGLLCWAPGGARGRLEFEQLKFFFFGGRRPPGPRRVAIDVDEKSVNVDWKR